MLRWLKGGEHLPENLQGVFISCANLAHTMDEVLLESAEKTAGMRKLLEAKDCFVRAKIETDEQESDTELKSGER